MPLVFLPQILWHSKDNKQCDRVYSLDFQPQLPTQNTGSTSIFKLATGGADEFVHIWQVSIHDNAPQYATHSDKSILAPENLRAANTTINKGIKDVQPFNVRILARLVGHIGEVNAVRWSPNGIILASGGEDRCVFLWAKSNASAGVDDAGQQYEENYTRFQYYRLSHVINSICWCPDGRLLAVTTEDGHVSLIDTFVEGNGRIRHFEGHTSFAQGVAICPQNIMIASMGQDQTLRIWKRRGERQWKSILVLRSAKDRSEFKESIGMESDDVRYSRSVFMNEELSTFFRRLDWSPDGRFLVTPAGIRHNSLFMKEDEVEDKGESVYTLYVFHRKLINLGIPMVTHQSPTGPFVAVKFCPLDIGKIEKEKINFFNKIFKPKGKGAKKKSKTSKTAAKGKQSPKAQLNTDMAQTMLNEVKTDDSATPSNAAGGLTLDDITESKSDEDVPSSNNASQDHVNECMDQESVETGQIKCEDNDGLKKNMIVELDLELESSHPLLWEHRLKVNLGSPPPNIQDLINDRVYVKVEPKQCPGENDIKDETESPTMASELIDETAPVHEDDEHVDEAAVDEQNDTVTTGVRTSKREIKKPQFYEATYDTPKGSKTKKPKKEEDKEYDTDVEDEVKVPRLMFAAGTLDGSLCFYDTLETRGPIAVLKNLHYCTITDIAWSPNGLVCATASSDGYITFVVFRRKEFY
ncbi:WD domain G-beta repeat family protein [Babesia bovis T2Bo]|uniref:Chromatin assembly factor 1 subunit B, putative n=1 Tax=Babesia bovis TaxID=5865 RepID=A7AR92_BABBO|nr:WD domain G-beta repeat family protein [Babesia bovis T2Bo]EDO07061.1 WD domain G-beta repeat family protein [Babesia bovis T2Bo]|eukprot:XP_001610629.1 chromatin assembly factor 1 subunit B [Babesia bovis T2Bo]